jgi:hypothetical protein
MNIIIYGAVGTTLAIAVWALGSWLVVRNIEKPAYTVLEKRDGYEIREYEKYIVAETEVTGTRQEALSEGFRIIADYIFGNNVRKSSIVMTSPVIESQTSESISMTTPVLDTEGEGNARTIAFVLPSSYTLETVPRPNNDKVNLREVPAHKVAALTFTWYATTNRVERKKYELLGYLQRDQVTPMGSVQTAQYNPPLSMPLVLRNEIIVPVE